MQVTWIDVLMRGIDLIYIAVIVLLAVKLKKLYGINHDLKVSNEIVNDHITKESAKHKRDKVLLSVYKSQRLPVYADENYNYYKVVLGTDHQWFVQKLVIREGYTKAEPKPAFNTRWLYADMHSAQNYLDDKARIYGWDITDKIMGEANRTKEQLYVEYNRQVRSGERFNERDGYAI